MSVIDKDLREKYQAVLQDLQERRANHLNAINELDAMIDGIGRQLQALENISGSEPMAARPSSVAATKSPDASDARRFANMSVRWAVLKLLASAPRPLTTGEIAKVLEAGGVESKGQRFNSIVSAVLSEMKSKKEEVESAEDGCYRLTDKGHEAWGHIEMSARYRYRDQVAASA